MQLINTETDALKYEIQEELRAGARIKVVGVGGGGCNAVARMVNEGLDGVEFYAINTDLQALSSSKVPSKLQIGAKITNGLGAGADPAVGKKAALEETERIVEMLQGADMVFVTAGLGAGTGGGASPVVASLARELEALTIAVVTKPFTFEGVRRIRQAEQAMTELNSNVDILIAIPNDRLLNIAPKGTSIFDAFRIADDVLRQAVQGISDIITTPGLINLDLSLIKSTMLGMGYAMMGTALARGENAVLEAARQAIQCPLLDGTTIAGARRMLVNVTGSSRLGLHEVNEACSVIREAAQCEDVQLSFGVILNESMADQVKITVIASGFRREEEPVAPPPRAVVEKRAQARAPEPAVLPEPEILPEPDPEPVYNPDDLDTPAYLRQGRLLN